MKTTDASVGYSMKPVCINVYSNCTENFTEENEQIFSQQTKLDFFMEDHYTPNNLLKIQHIQIIKAPFFTMHS